MASRDTELNTCGCCEAESTEGSPSNPPGLSALRYRIGSHSQFLARMLHALPLAGRRDTPGGHSPAGRSHHTPDPDRPLAGLTTRAEEDTTIALLDATAVVADILTFYQERLANEGFLATATERRSVLELARAIGYELGPGVAATAYLSFAVEDAAGAPLESMIARGTPVQSVPPQGKLPQVFETGAESTARAEWNALRPRLTRPAEMAIHEAGDTRRLVLLGPRGSFPAGDVLDPAPTHAQLFRLGTAETTTDEIDAVAIETIYLTEAGTPPEAGALMLFAGKRDGVVKTLVLRALAATPEPERKRIRVDVETLDAPIPPETRPRPVGVPYKLKAFGTFARVRLQSLSFNALNVRSTVLRKTWRERDLQALLRIQRWSRRGLMRLARTKPKLDPVESRTGAFAMRTRVGFFGNNAPKWSSLPKSTTTNAQPYAAAWDADDQSAGTPAADREVWQDSQGGSLPSRSHVYLERPIPGINPGDWVLFTDPAQNPTAYTVNRARDESRVDFGLSSRALALTLGDAQGTALMSTSSQPKFRFRTAVAHVAGANLDFAELPIDNPVGDTNTIELDEMVLGLDVGQPIALTGERSDAPGIDAAEIAFLADVIHAEGKTTLVLTADLEYTYLRGTLRISANVVPATHGETVHEILGSGDASRSNQRFALKKPPLTHVSSPSSGAQSTLEVRVNGILWKPASSLYELGPHDEGYTVRIDDDAVAEVIFGDGIHGARLPTGMANVSASYRSGIGPEGEVAAASLTLLRTMPLGVRGVANPRAADGAEGPEKLKDARTNAPLTVLTFDRVVSLDDYENYARTYPGIGKARGDLLVVDGVSMVHLTVAGATGGLPAATTVTNLVQAIRDRSDPSQSFQVQAFVPRFFTCEARLAIDPRHDFGEVKDAVAEKLQEAFGFEARAIAQSVTAAEVIQVAHQVAGLVAIAVDVLAPYSEEAGSATSGTATVEQAEPVPALRARWNAATRTAEPADLLLVNPVGIELSRMT